jgi:hypothetical protein
LLLVNAPNEPEVVSLMGMLDVLTEGDFPAVMHVKG